MDANPFQQWYDAPLSGSDILAGGLLIVLPVIFICFYAIVAIVLWKSSKEIIGFRYLLSSALADILVMIQYGLLDGIAIITKSDIVNKSGRFGFHFFLEWGWFACCLHLPLIAWSRLHAVAMPLSFRLQRPWMSYGFCFVCTWLLSLIICAASSWQPFHVCFYFEPALYGTAAEDFVKYQRDGHSQMYMGIHVVVVVLPLLFYSLTIILLIKHRSFLGAVQSEGSRQSQSVETRLIVPCILVTIVFAIGQVMITMGTGTGPWAMWAVCFIFFANSALQSVLLVAFSPSLRKGVVSLLRIPLQARKKSAPWTSGLRETRTVASTTSR